MNPAHYDYDTLADLAEGLLEDDQAASVNAHLESCAQCRDRSADLADVSRLLAEAPVPSIPAELASRIDSAIAAESLNSATVVSLEQRRGRRHWRILSAAAATVLVLGGGGIVGKMALDGNGEAVQTRAPAADNQDGGQKNLQGEGGGAASPRDSAKIAPGEPGPSGTGYKVTGSGTDYRPDSLDSQVNAALTDEAARQAKTGPPDSRLAGCVGQVTGGRTPDLVDSAKYDGAPAYVIAAPGRSGGTLDVWVVGPECSVQDVQLRKHVTINRRT